MESAGPQDDPHIQSDQGSTQQKDAQIAALLERNSALADLAFATRDLNLQDAPQEHPSKSTRSSSAPISWAYSCMLAIAVLSQISDAHIMPPLLCSNKAPVSYWKIPTDINCSQILPSISAKVKPLTINVYRPNTVRYRSIAHVCRVITQTATYSVNFFGARSQSVVSHEHTVPPESCRHMVAHKACAHGDLITVGTVLKTMNTLEIDWPSAPFQCCTDYSVSVSNCIVFQASIFAYHGSDSIESSIGPMDNCNYHRGECNMQSGSAVIWTPDSQESCRYIYVSSMKGTLAEKVWLSDSKEFALSFSLSATPIFDCGHSLIITDQGYAIESLSYYRSKRHVNLSSRQQVGLATTNQLAAQLLAVEDGMQQSMSESFHHAILALCKSINSLSASLIAAISANPTIAMRNILQRSDIEAKFLGNNIVRTKSCASLSPSMYSLSPFNKSCFSLPSISVFLPDKTHWKAFLDPVTNIISHTASAVPCSTDLLFEFPFNDSVSQYMPLSGSFRVIPRSTITVIEHSFNRPQSTLRPALTLFHNLVITNISEFVPEQQFSELWAALEGNQVALEAHTSATTHHDPTKPNILTTPSFPLSFPSFLLTTIYKPWVTLCCIVVSVQFLSRIIMLYISSQIPTHLFQYVARFYRKRGRSQPQPMPAPQNYSTPAESPIPLEPAPFPTVYTLSVATQSLSTHIRITVNGVNVSALIDTGSSITLAAQNLCAALGVFTLDPPQSITAMGMAGIHVPMAGSKKVQLRIANICLQHTLHFTKGSCVPNIHSAYEVILGNDLLALLPTMTIDYQNHQVSFGQATLPLGQAVRPPQPFPLIPFPVCVSDTIKLQRNMETFVPCTLNNWEEATDFTLVSQAMRLFQRDLSVAPAIINSKQPVLLVSNPTNQPQTLYAGMHIAKAMPLTKEIALTDHSEPSLPPIAATCVDSFDGADPSYRINLDQCDVTDTQRSILRKLLDRYADVFSRHQYDIGSCTAGKVHIYTTDDPPAKIRPYRVPVKYREEIQKHINLLLKAGVMKESQTHWVHNLVVVRKKDDILRVCLDMRRPINEVT
ncbi:hypothetical protein V3C99_012519, partial [Haemonchus contortus]